jgi:hypothetical protein
MLAIMSRGTLFEMHTTYFCKFQRVRILSELMDTQGEV